MLEVNDVFKNIKSNGITHYKVVRIKKSHDTSDLPNVRVPKATRRTFLPCWVVLQEQKVIDGKFAPIEVSVKTLDCKTLRGEMWVKVDPKQLLLYEQPQDPKPIIPKQAHLLLDHLQMQIHVLGEYPNREGLENTLRVLREMGLSFHCKSDPDLGGLDSEMRDWLKIRGQQRWRDLIWRLIGYKIRYQLARFCTDQIVDARLQDIWYKNLHEYLINVPLTQQHILGPPNLDELETRNGISN